LNLVLCIVFNFVGLSFINENTPFILIELIFCFRGWYNSLIVLRDNELHSISFPLISAGIYGGKLPNPVSTSTENCIKAYNKFKEENPDYEIDVRLCAFTEKEYLSALEVYNNLYEEEHKLKK